MKKNDLLESYIMRLYQIQEERRNQVTPDDLRAAAEAVGLSEREMEEIEQLSQNQLKRGRTYMKVGRWDEAEAEYNKALELNSMRVEYVLEAASFYLSRYSSQKNKRDLEEADKFAKTCLELVPDYTPAQVIFQEIDRLHRKKKRKKMIRNAILLFFSPFVALFLFVVVKEGVLNKIPHGMEGKNYHVPILVEENPELEGITLDFSEGEIIHADYTGSSSFDFNFNCRVNANRFEVVELGFKALFLDAKDKVLADTYYWFWYEGAMSLRPQNLFYYRDNDKWASGHFDGDVAKVAKVKMTVQGIKKFSGATQYPNSKPLPVSWICEKSGQQKLEIRQRSNQVAVMHPSDKSTNQKLVLEIKNTGSQNCRALDLQMEWFNSEGQLIEDKLYPVIFIGEKELEPNQTLVYFIDRKFYENPFGYPKPFATFKVKVKSIQ